MPLNREGRNHSYILSRDAKDCKTERVHVEDLWSSNYVYYGCLTLGAIIK